MDQAIGLREMMNTKKRPLRVIGVASGKGGVGKSNISANLAVLAAKQGMRVLVIDADLGLANVEVLYGMKPQYHLGHVLEWSMPIQEVIATGPEGVKVLPAGSGVQSLTRLDDAQKLKLVTALEQLEDSVDLVLVDTGAGIGDNVVFFIGATQEALLVVNPEPTSLTDAYAMVKVLSLNAGTRFFNVIVNCSPNDGQAKDIFQKLSNVAARFLDVKLRYLGWVPRDENVHRAVMAQSPIVLSFPNSPASRALNATAHQLFSEPPPFNLDGGMKLLWSRLFKDSNSTGAAAPSPVAG
jgi:flagellar biosynthesis protein FlhG